MASCVICLDPTSAGSTHVVECCYGAVCDLCANEVFAAVAGGVAATAVAGTLPKCSSCNSSLFIINPKQALAQKSLAIIQTTQAVLTQRQTKIIKQQAESKTMFATVTANSITLWDQLPSLMMGYVLDTHIKRRTKQFQMYDEELDTRLMVTNQRLNRVTTAAATEAVTKDAPTPEFVMVAEKWQHDTMEIRPPNSGDYVWWRHPYEFWRGSPNRYRIDQLSIMRSLSETGITYPVAGDGYGYGLITGYRVNTHNGDPYSQIIEFPKIMQEGGELGVFSEDAISEDGLEMFSLENSCVPLPGAFPGRTGWWYAMLYCSMYSYKIGVWFFDDVSGDADGHVYTDATSQNLRVLVHGSFYDTAPDICFWDDDTHGPVLIVVSEKGIDYISLLTACKVDDFGIIDGYVVNQGTNEVKYLGRDNELLYLLITKDSMSSVVTYNLLTKVITPTNIPGKLEDGSITGVAITIARTLTTYSGFRWDFDDRLYINGTHVKTDIAKNIRLAPLWDGSF